jgi:HSP20 family molecular chaperone IbpA
MDHPSQEMKKREALHLAETERTRTRKVFVPAVDIYETKDKIILNADVPGVDEKSINVTLEKNVLTITAETEPMNYEGYTVSHIEYDTGDYQRSFTISDDVDPDNIEATVKNGVLKVMLHKSEKAKVKTIPIKTE